MHKVVWGKVCSEEVRGPVLICIPGFEFGMYRASSCELAGLDEG